MIQTTPLDLIMVIFQKKFKIKNIFRLEIDFIFPSYTKIAFFAEIFANNNPPKMPFCTFMDRFLPHY